LVPVTGFRFQVSGFIVMAAKGIEITNYDFTRKGRRDQGDLYFAGMPITEDNMPTSEDVRGHGTGNWFRYVE
jgi:hypothetical protein